MADSSFGPNVSFTQRLATVDDSGTNFQWIFMDNIPFKNSFNQWCPTFDQSGDLYFYSDFHCADEPCLYRYNFTSKQATLILFNVSNSCPSSYQLDGENFLVVPLSINSVTAYGVLDMQTWRQLFNVPQVNTESVTGVDQFFECSVFSPNRTLMCVHALGRSLVLINWQSATINSTFASGSFDLALNLPVVTAFESPALITL